MEPKPQNRRAVSSASRWLRPVCQALQARACCWTHARAFLAVTVEVVAYGGRKNSSELVVTLSGLGLCGQAGQLGDVQSLFFLGALGRLLQCRQDAAAT